MLQYHFTNPDTLNDYGPGMPFEEYVEPLVEFQFLHNNKRMYFKVPDYADEHDFTSAGPGTPLGKDEQYKWISKILCDEVRVSIREDMNTEQADNPLVQEEWKFFSDPTYRFSLYIGDSNIPVEKMLEIIEHFGIEPHKYRMYIPIVWNETLERFNKLRHGDTCRVHFVYSKDLQWYANHLNDFCTRLNSFTW